jgi:hypothetical protein
MANCKCKDKYCGNCHGCGIKVRWCMDDCVFVDMSGFGLDAMAYWCKKCWSEIEKESEGKNEKE